MNDVIRIRPLIDRIIRLPKFWQLHWSFAVNLSFIDKIKFILRMTYIVLR